MQQKSSYAKSKQATEPQTKTYTATIGGYIHSEFHAIPLHGYGETPSKLSTTVVCVTTVTVPVHLHGTNFAPFLLLTRRCYDAETSAILLLLKRAFA